MLSDSSQGESSVMRDMRVIKGHKKSIMNICIGPLRIHISGGEYALVEVEYTSPFVMA